MKILFCSDTLACVSGLNYASLNLCLQLKQAGHDVHYGILQGSEANSTCSTIHLPQFQELISSMLIINCQHHVSSNFDKAMSMYSYDVVISLMDPWLLDVIHYSKYRSSFIHINYALFEVATYPEYVNSKSPFTKNIQKPIGEFYRSVDINIPVTQLAREGLEKFKAPVYKDNILLGIDTKAVQKRLPKNEIFGSSVMNDDFIFCSINRNSERKLLPLLLEGFSIFLKKQSKPSKFKLYLHTNLAESIGGTDLVMMSHSLGIQHNLIIPKCFMTGEQFSQKELYKRIAASDCYVSTSGGEGFGYGVLEAMMHHLQIIFSDTGATREFCKDAYIIKPSFIGYANNAYMRWGLVDPKDVAYYMEKAVKTNKKVNHSIDHLDWKVVGKHFVKAVEDIVKNQKPKIRMERVI